MNKVQQYGGGLSPSLKSYQNDTSKFGYTASMIKSESADSPPKPSGPHIKAPSKTMLNFNTSPTHKLHISRQPDSDAKYSIPFNNTIDSIAPNDSEKKDFRP